MQSIQKSQVRPLTQAELIQRRHDHHDTGSADWATQFTSGVLDVHLMLDAGFHVDEGLMDCHTVHVKYAGTTRNFATKKVETLFAVHDSNGNFIGHYFSGAFKALMH